MSTSVINQRSTDNNGHIPGEAGIWVFVIGDLMIFALIFTVFTYYRGLDVTTFNTGQATLNESYGAINTLLLLTSSWFVVMAIHAAKDRNSQVSANFFALTMLCGAGFIVIKFLEYAEKIEQGFILTTNDFYMFYYILTGLHFAHVIIGMIVLGFAWNRCRLQVRNDKDTAMLESCATYWHMVDVLWIMLFPLVYLLK